MRQVVTAATHAYAHAYWRGVAYVEHAQRTLSAWRCAPIVWRFARCTCGAPHPCEC